MPHDKEIPGTPADWLVRARADLAMARAPLPEGAVYEALCFHAQQAAEKAIKAIYRARRQGFRYTHDIDDLLHGLERHGTEVPEAIWAAAELTSFAWQDRYPGSAEPATVAEYRDAVAIAGSVVQWAASLVEGGGP